MRGFSVIVRCWIGEEWCSGISVKLGLIVWGGPCGGYGLLGAIRSQFGESAFSSTYALDLIWQAVGNTLSSVISINDIFAPRSPQSQTSPVPFAS